MNSEDTRRIVSHDGESQKIHSSLPSKDYESLDYDLCYNEPYMSHMAQQSSRSKFHRRLMKWVFAWAIGVSTGIVAFLIDYIVKIFNGLKYKTVSTVIEDGINESSESKFGYLALSLFYMMCFNLGFTFIAALLTYYEPVAGGSGIPEIKCYLNGIKVPNVVRAKSLISKAVGVLFSVAGGLLVGKEGPMIHSGAILGAGIPQLKTYLFGKLQLPYDVFRSDRDKRDFVSSGAAAGVAAAFGAPIGGVLFALEEGASFWNQSLTWRTLFCSMSATFTLNFLISGSQGSWGSVDKPGLVNFGVFRCKDDDKCELWSALDVLIFMAMAVVGGLLGALFNFLNTRITVLRMRFYKRRRKSLRIIETLLVAFLTTAVAFTASMALGQCNVLPTHYNTSSASNEEIRTYFCDQSSNQSVYEL